MSRERREKVEERARGVLIGMALQELRQARPLMQKELVEILDINQAALSKMENQGIFGLVRCGSCLGRWAAD